MKQRELFLLTIPVLMGYIPLGAAFGILAASKDFSLFEILLSSIFIYAGLWAISFSSFSGAKCIFFDDFFYFVFIEFFAIFSILYHF